MNEIVSLGEGGTVRKNCYLLGSASANRAECHTESSLAGTE